MRPDRTDPGIDPRQARPDLLTQPRRATTADGTTTADGDIVESWQDIKSRFVDDPAGALAAAERLVKLTVEHKIRALQDEAAAVYAADRDDDPSSSTATEAMRTRLLRYQEYCERLAGGLVH